MHDLVLCSFGFVYTWIYSASYILSKYFYRLKKLKLETRQNGSLKEARYQRRRLRITIMGLPLLCCMAHSYRNLCSLQVYESWDVFGCFRNFNNEKIAKGILVSFYMSTLLYIGPIYQEMWNGNMRRKLAKLSFNKFRWDYFTKIVIIPVIEEIIFRGLVNNSINFDFVNNSFFIIYSTGLYSVARMLSFWIKFTNSTKKELSIEFTIQVMELLSGVMLGGYLSYVLIKTQTLVSVIINHGYLNFMGTPNFRELLVGDLNNSVKQKTLKFYALGIAAFFILICVI